MLLKLVVPILFSLSVFAQSDKYLIIKHRTKSKEVVIQEGAFVVVKTFKGERVNGNMLVLSEALIKVKHKVVPLTNVERIGIRNRAMVQLGSAAVSMGMNLVFYGLQNNFRNGWKQVDDSYMVSAPFLAAGVSMIWFNRKRKSKHWIYKGQMPGW
ncbi:MAG: hypothetical protein JXR19_03515 [Bacteroidia bacterium]